MQSEKLKTTQMKIRLPADVRQAIQEKAAREGLSLNSAIVQRLVWSIEKDRKNGQQ